MMAVTVETVVAETYCHSLKNNVENIEGAASQRLDGIKGPHVYERT